MNKHLKYCYESIRFTLTYGLSFLFFKNLISWWYYRTYWLPDWIKYMTPSDALGFVVFFVPMFFVGSLIREYLEYDRTFKSRLDRYKDI